jgi:hypothetical protein
VVDRLTMALEPDDVVSGGGNVNKSRKLPPSCRQGDNANAFAGGFRMWENADGRFPHQRPGVKEFRKKKGKSQ